jgi:Xaa-Pro aminopeptidase
MIPSILTEARVDAWAVLTREDSDPTLPLILPSHLVMDTALIFTPSGSTALLGHISMASGHGRYFDRVVEYTPGKLEDVLAPVLRELNPRVLALNYSESDYTADGLSHGFFRRLVDAVGEEWLSPRMVSAEDVVSQLRAVKSPTEIGLIEEAARITVKVAAEMSPLIRPGMTHGEIYDLFRRIVLADGRSEPEFFIATSGRIGKILRGDVDYRVEPGDSLILDIGVRYQGYASDYKRMWYFLERGQQGPPDDLKRAFDLVRDVIRESVVNCRAGRLGYEVNAEALARMTEAGYDEFQHALGHGVGRAVHDGGATLGRKERYKRASTTIKANMVLTLEPGIKMPNHYPVSLEEMCVTQNAGPARLLVPPQDCLMLVPSIR